MTLTVADAAERYRLTEPDRLYTGLGFQFWVPRIPAIVGNVIADGPAAKAGVLPGDQIVGADGAPITQLQRIHGLRERAAEPGHGAHGAP